MVIVGFGHHWVPFVGDTEDLRKQWKGSKKEQTGSKRNKKKSDIGRARRLRKSVKKKQKRAKRSKKGQKNASPRLLDARFAIYAKNAAERDNHCRIWTSLGPFRGRHGRSKKTAKRGRKGAKRSKKDQTRAKKSKKEQTRASPRLLDARIAIYTKMLQKAMVIVGCWTLLGPFSWGTQKI